jgi:hypothetical protein
LEGRRRDRCAGTEEETVEELGRLEQADEGTWESQGDVECEKAKQNDIDVKYKDGVVDRDGHCGRMGVELTETRRGELKKKVLVSHDGTMHVPRGRYGRHGEKRPRAKLKVNYKTYGSYERVTDRDDTIFHPILSVL